MTFIRRVSGPFGHNSRATRRGGFTLIELLVVISVIGVLVAIILPAVMTTRAAARRVQCQNQMRQVGLAILLETELARKFPVAGYWGTATNPGPFYNWVVQILPSMEQKPLYNQWKFDGLLYDPINQLLYERNIPVLVCPDDQTVTGQGDLSYVVNGGIGWTTHDCYVKTQFGGIDLNANGIACGVDTTQLEPPPGPTDRDYRAKMGLFFLDNWPPPGNGRVQHHTLTSVRDGLTHTIMLGENVHAGSDSASTSGLANWASPGPRRTMFFLSPYICTNFTCGPGAVDYHRANNHTDPYKVAAINYLPTPVGSLEGKSPFPSSYHRGGVNFAFADGRVKFVSEVVDGQVYATLLSPAGNSISGPLAQPIVSDADY
jgi:prepilin-type N-terminal cleavage/methylation domain-containing protein/prepilin-type processing-associated H-X9-DG protein